MNIRSGRLFPNPVLWFANDDYKDSDFRMDMDYKEEFGKLLLDYRFHLDNEDLLCRIIEGDLAFCIHIECSLTMFRESVITNELSGHVELDSKKLNDKLEVLPLIIALRDIANYNNSKLHEDYTGAHMNIYKGSVVAVSDYRYFFIDKEKNDLGLKESIFSFVKNEQKQPMKIETDDQKIIIRLKDEDFKQLQLLQSSAKYQPVVFSMFIVPALIFALESVGEDLDEMREHLWFRSLEKSYAENGIELNQAVIAQKTSYQLAQLLLQDPVSRALLVLNESGGEC